MSSEFFRGSRGGVEECAPQNGKEAAPTYHSEECGETKRNEKKRATKVLGI